uniref:Uncharacterized protein n=1 Tax=Romanomermis culicivorax TaxID=13658 RepID=A0A915L734_ROMCU
MDPKIDQQLERVLQEQKRFRPQERAPEMPNQELATHLLERLSHSDVSLQEKTRGHLYLLFPIERNVTDQQLEPFRLKGRKGYLSANLWKTTDGYLQPNCTDRKYPFRSVTFRPLHAVPFRPERQSSNGNRGILPLLNSFKQIENLEFRREKFAVPTLLDVQQLEESLSQQTTQSRAQPSIQQLV